MKLMRQVTLKYNTLTQRLSAGEKSGSATALSIWGAQVKEIIQQDRFAQKIRLTDDILTGKHSSQLSYSELQAI